MGDLVGRWWNRKRGRLARRDIWLERDGDAYLVRAREGDSEGNETSWRYACEPDARARVDQLIDTDGGPAAWNDLTSLYQPGEDPPAPPAG